MPAPTPTDQAAAEADIDDILNETIAGANDEARVASALDNVLLVAIEAFTGLPSIDTAASSGSFRLIYDGSTWEWVRDRFLQLQAAFSIPNATTGLTTITDSGSTTFSISQTAGETWEYELVLRADLQAGTDLEAKVVVPASSTGWTALDSTGFNLDTSSGTIAVSTGNDQVIRWKAVVTTTATGNVQFQLANDTGSNSQQIDSDSYLIARRLA